MKVVLTQDIPKLGRAGEVRKVADGYARNYLIPQGFAIPATPAALKQVEEIKRRVAREQERLATELAQVAARIQGMTLTFQARAAESGKLYGSITPTHIVEALAERTGVQIDRRKVESEPLRELGAHTVKIHLAPDLQPDITVVILREGEEAPAPVSTETAAPAPEAQALEQPEETAA